MNKRPAERRRRSWCSGWSEFFDKPAIRGLRRNRVGAVWKVGAKCLASLAKPGSARRLYGHLAGKIRDNSCPENALELVH